MDRRYRNTFDQIHMSEACQARILEAASSACTQEDQTAMKKTKTVLKTMLLAAALAGCLSAVAYASNNMLPAQLNQLANVVLTSDGNTTQVNSDNVEKRQEADGSTTYILEEENTEAAYTINEPALKSNRIKVTVQESGDTEEVIFEDAETVNEEMSLEDTETVNLEPESTASETIAESTK